MFLVSFFRLATIRSFLLHYLTHFLLFLQVIVFYEFSPLLKLGTDRRVHDLLMKKFEAFLYSIPDKKIKLLE